MNLVSLLAPLHRGWRPVRVAAALVPPRGIGGERSSSNLGEDDIGIGRKKERALAFPRRSCSSLRPYVGGRSIAVASGSSSRDFARSSPSGRGEPVRAALEDAFATSRSEAGRDDYYEDEDDEEETEEMME